MRRGSAGRAWGLGGTGVRSRPTPGDPAELGRQQRARAPHSHARRPPRVPASGGPELRAEPACGAEGGPWAPPVSFAFAVAGPLRGRGGGRLPGRESDCGASSRLRAPGTGGTGERGGRFPRGDPERDRMGTRSRGAAAPPDAAAPGGLLFLARRRGSALPPASRGGSGPRALAQTPERAAPPRARIRAWGPTRPRPRGPSPAGRRARSQGLARWGRRRGGGSRGAGQGDGLGAALGAAPLPILPCPVGTGTFPGFSPLLAAVRTQH